MDYDDGVECDMMVLVAVIIMVTLRMTMMMMRSMLVT